MDILVMIVVICVIASTVKKNQTRSRRQYRRNAPGRGQAHWGSQTVYPRKREQAAQTASRQPQNPAGSPIPELPRSSSDWDGNDRKSGEDELEALIPQNHLYEEELKKRLAVRDE